MKFRDLAIGDTFDFVNDGSIYNSFYSSCKKTGVRTYEYANPVWCSLSPRAFLRARVGTINVEVYHRGIEYP